MRTICVIGTGYVGLVSGACLADFGNAVVCVDIDESRIATLMTEWNEFRNPDFAAVKEALREPVLFDGRNLWRRDLLEQMGFTYYGIGC